MRTHKRAIVNKLRYVRCMLMNAITLADNYRPIGTENVSQSPVDNNRIRADGFTNQL